VNNTNRIFLATFGGGVWRSTDGGTSWTPTTDNQPSLQIGAIKVHPSNSNLVFAGTGQFDPLSRGFGVYRSTDGGTSWCLIGPTYQGGQVAAVSLSIDTSDNPARLWAATSKGLWYSTNAANPATACGSVTWTQVSSLPTQGGSPNRVRHIFVSPLNRDVLYAAIADSTTPSQNGWWRSSNRGTSWTQRNGSLTNPPAVGRAVIAQTPNQGAGTDLIYAIMSVSGVATQCGYPPSPKERARLYRGVLSSTTTSWTLVTAAKSCQTAGECCDDPPLGCRCANVNTGNACQTGETCICEPNGDCGGLRSVQVDFSNPNVVVFGNELLFRSTSGAAPGSFKQLGRTALHDDHHALTFNPANHDIFFDGNDGGIWKSSANFSDGAVNPTWTNLNANLANIMFHRAGVPDKLNEATSAAGTQDNGYMKGGNPAEWHQIVSGGDGAMVLVDPKNSNVLYVTDLGGFTIDRSLDGGLNRQAITAGLPPFSSGGHLITDGSGIDKLAMDPSANPSTALVAWSAVSKKIYRTTNACDGTPTCGGTPVWSSITNSPPTVPNPDNEGEVTALAIAPSATPPSNLIFAGSQGGGGVWRTTDASSWTKYGTTSLPERTITSFAIPSSPPCTPSACVVYVSFSGANSQGGQSGHVFRSTDAGQNWTNVSTNLPDLPVAKVVVHPSNPNVLYAGTDMGIYKGTLSGSTWSWATFTTGFPASADVKDLTVHPESGLLRAYTFGRSAWEYPAFPVENPDIKVNTTVPVTGSLHNSVRIGASKTGDFYSVAWADDRAGANNWHVYFRAYNYVSGSPSPLSATDLRVDDTSAHVVGPPAIAAHPTQTAVPYCSRYAWHDDRLNPGVYRHVYNQYACSDGYKLFSSDVRVDQHATNINATNPAITNQQDNLNQPLDYAVAWQADRAAGSTLHDVYARFFGPFGNAKGNQFQVNTPAANVDATNPAVAADSSLNVFIAWEEFNTATLDGKIMISKYDPNGTTRLAGPVQVNTLGNATERHEVALAVDSAGNVIVAWWERKSDGTQPESVYRRRLTNTLGSGDVEQVRVDQPPGVPPGVRDARVGIATDTSNRVAVTYYSTKNDYGAGGIFGNIFARVYSSAGGSLKNEFRIDLAPRSSRPLQPRVARSSQPSRFVYAWRDDRSGKYEVYTRLVRWSP
jgi:photosystem II stability/assembly factor-like uncharacterized protein